MALRTNQISHKASWWDESSTQFDTVVFVHGILGDPIKTWGDFPALLNEDPDLPKLSILQWGYESGLKPSMYHDILAESQGLMSDMRLATCAGEPIHIVAHSMGGLIALNGISESVTGCSERTNLVDSISLVTLYATPLRGSKLAQSILKLVNRVPFLGWFSRFLPRKQLEALQPTGFVDRLRGRANKNLTSVALDEDTPESKITVQIVAGKKDKSVSKASAEGLFSKDPDTLLLEGTHSSVKLPVHLNDSRYKALKNNLEIKLSHRLYRLAQDWKTGSSQIGSGMAANRIFEQYESQLNQCFDIYFGDRNQTDQEKEYVFTTFLLFAAEGKHTPKDLIQMIKIDYGVSKGLFPMPPIV